MENYSEAQRLLERARHTFDRVSSLPEGNLDRNERRQIFDAIRLLSNNIRCELIGSMQKSGIDPLRIDAVNKVVNHIDDSEPKTKIEALMFVTECLGLAQLLPYADMPAKPPVAEIPKDIFKEMYETMRRFARVVIESSEPYVSHDSLCNVVYGDTALGNQGKLAQLASRANKILEPYGQIMGVYGKGYMWQPKSAHH